MTGTSKRTAEFNRIVAIADHHHEAGRVADAEAAYRAALDILPSHSGVLHNLGVLAATRGDHPAAIERFEAAIAGDPGYASAHYNRAVVLGVLGLRNEAISGFTRAAALSPEHYDSHRALGFLWLAEGNRDRALDHFARTYELRRGEDCSGIAAKSLTHSTRSKLLHDAAQFRHIAGLLRDGQRFDAIARNYETVGGRFPHTAAKLSDADIEVLGEDYNTAINVRAAPEIAEGAVAGRNDREELIRKFRAGRTGAVYFDDLLTPRALAALQRYLLESTIWHDFSHIGGFVASYLEDGLACPLILQIADELRGVFPQILGKHPLAQAWAFKGLERSSAVDVHADDSVISVNLWLTATEANRNPGRGGLVVCQIPPPPEWVIRDYDADQARIVAFLEQNAEESLRVSYRENRAVLFESRLFHFSDAPEFAAGHQNRRINITLLYGSNAQGAVPEVPAQKK